MVRAPCCEKMGLKKGPWTAEEDQILVSFIKRFGHGNWRALPKQAGLLRCGKSCRLRWTNYLRPDIKRGNFSKEEEETIISLHEMLGNRWSAIAARLPGRTDNEIKNVWHTHLKKRVIPNQTVEESNQKARSNAKNNDGSKPVTLQQNPTSSPPSSENATPASSDWSYSEVSCSGTDSSNVTEENTNMGIKEDCIDSSQEFLEIDESFWIDALSMDNCSMLMDVTAPQSPNFGSIGEPFCSVGSSNHDDMNFWLTILMEGEDLPEI